MNPYIVKLIRLRYAQYMLADDRLRQNDIDDIIHELNAPLVVNGKCNDIDYVDRIFNDISGRRGVTLNDDNQRNTRKRILGIIGGDSYRGPSDKIKSELCRYLDYPNLWEDLEHEAEALCQELERQIGDGTQVGTCMQVRNYRNSPRILCTETFRKYDTITIKLEGQGHLKLECIRQGQFKVTKSTNTQLQVGDIINTSLPIFRGSLLMFLDVVREQFHQEYFGSHRILSLDYTLLTEQDRQRAYFAPI